MPNRRWQGETKAAPRDRQNARELDWRQRGPERAAPAPPAREYRPDPREYRAPAPPAREYREPPRVERGREYSAPSSRPAAPASGSRGRGKNSKG